MLALARYRGSGSQDARQAGGTGFPSWTQQGTVPTHGSRFSGAGESFCLSAESSLKPLALSLQTVGLLLLKLQFLLSSAGDSVV